MASEDRTMSPARSAPGATPKAAKSSKTKVNWDKVKVFDRPELRLGLRLAKYTKGRGGLPPEPWVEAAIQSGLLELASPNAGDRRHWIEPIDGQPLQGLSLDDILREKTASTLKRLEELNIDIKRDT